MNNLNNINNDYGYVTVTKIKTDDPKVLKTIIKDGKLDLTATPSEGTHTLKNFDSTMCWAEIETWDCGFGDVIKELHRLYPDAYIYYEQMGVIWDDDAEYSDRRVYHYKDGDFEGLYKGEHELWIDSIEHLVGYKINKELETVAHEMQMHLDYENLLHLEYRMFFDEMEILCRISLTKAKFKVVEAQTKKKDDEKLMPKRAKVAIKTHNSEILGTIIKDGKLDLEGLYLGRLNEENRHILMVYDQQLKYASFDSLGGLEEVVYQLSKKFPNEYIKYESHVYPQHENRKQVFEYMDGNAVLVAEEGRTKTMVNPKKIEDRIYDMAFEKKVRIEDALTRKGIEVIGLSFWADDSFQKVIVSELGEQLVVSVQKEQESFAYDSMQKSEYDKLFNQQGSFNDPSKNHKL